MTVDRWSPVLGLDIEPGSIADGAVAISLEVEDATAVELFGVACVVELSEYLDSLEDEVIVTTTVTGCADTDAGLGTENSVAVSTTVVGSAAKAVAVEMRMEGSSNDHLALVCRPPRGLSTYHRSSPSY
jgi:hypothetical protein